MAYQGGKGTIGAELSRVILAWERRTGNADLPYLEPFFGLGGVAQHIVATGRKVWGNDANKDLILLLRALQRGWHPPHVSREERDRLKASPHHSALRGYAGLVYSYRGVWWAGYSVRDEDRRRDRLLRIGKLFRSVRFTSRLYDTLRPHGMLIYCDPPYQGHLGYTAAGAVPKFHSDRFWRVARAWSRDNVVLVSEYKAPAGWKAIWTKSVHTTLGGRALPRKEKLFVYQPRQPDLP